MRSKLIFSDFTMTSADTMGGVTYRQTINSGTDLQYGCAAMAEVSFSFRTDNFDKGIVFEGQTFTLQISQAENGESYEQFGIFTVYTVEKKGGKTNVTAYDNMIKFEKYADEFLSNVSYPTTMRILLQNVCEECGVEISDETFDNLVNLDLPMTANVSMGNGTFRNLISYIAEAGVCNIFMNSSGKLAASRYRITTITIDKTKYITCELAEYSTDLIDDVIANTAYGLIKVTGNSNVYYVPSNPILNTYDFDTSNTAVETIYNSIGNISYVPSNIKLFQDFGANAGDIITVNGVSTIVMEKTMKSSGVTLKSTGNKRRESKLDNVVTVADLSPYVTTEKLSAQIGAYLDSESGQASIVSATSGKFVTQESFIESNTEISQNISNIESSISLSAEYGSGTIGSNVRALLTLFSDADSSDIHLSANAITISAQSNMEASEEAAGTLETLSDVTYPFVLGSDGYYESTNQGVDRSFSYAKILFNFTEETEILLSCINYAEPGWDYGIISEVDYNLTKSYGEDTDGVFHSFIKENSSDAVSLTMSIPSGEHFITIKYRKDGSNSSYNDSLKFKITKNIPSKSAIITLKSGDSNISSATIDLAGVVSFTDLSESGKTVINGANITTGKISAEFIETDGIKVTTVYAQDTGGKVIVSDYNNNQIFIGAVGERATDGWSDCDHIRLITNDDILIYSQYADETYGFIIKPLTGSGDYISTAGFFPQQDNYGYLGSENNRWSSVFARNIYVNTLYYGKMYVSTELQ